MECGFCPARLYCQPCSGKGGGKATFPAYSVVENGKPFELVQYPMPEPTGTQVLIRTTYAGMCHSELHLWEGYFDMGGGRKLPMKKASREEPYTLGHEFEGLIVAAGESVPLNEFDMQKSYAVFPWIGCDRPEECAHCANGEMNWCSSPKSQRFIDGKSQYGGYGSYILVPHFKYLMDYEGALPRGLGCVYMCSGLTAFSALECAYKSRNPPRSAEDLMIVGCGGLGFQGLGMAIGMNGPPLAADIDEEKLAMAAKLGCKTFNTMKKDAVNEIKALSKGGVGAVIDFVGNEKSHAFCNKVIRTGGKVVVIGLMGGKMESPLPMFVFQSKSIEGSLVGNMRQAKEMIELMRGGKVPIVPHQFRSIFEVNNAFQDLIEGKIVGRCVLKHEWEGPEASKI
jgi:D-arabinose 1-dehydrogenase-like Zn-dependent alcohol dehydrogenase